MRTHLVVYGTRPEAIKLFPVVQALRASGQAVVLCNTGQHPDLVPTIESAFDVKSDFVLESVPAGSSLSVLASRLFVGIDEVLDRLACDTLIIQGDTTSATVGAIAGFHRKVPVAHVEAGLRTRDLENPFPEEGNRQMIARVASWHFAPTLRAQNALLDEGVEAKRIKVVGNTGIDALMFIKGRELPWQDESLAAAYSSNRRKVLITLHRRESWGDTMALLVQAVWKLASQIADVDFVVAMHVNPKLQLLWTQLPTIENLHLVKPMTYSDMVRAMDRSVLIATDSGGIQEEAPSLGCPVIVLRVATERAEGLELGIARLAGTDPDTVTDAILHALNDKQFLEFPAKAKNPYGDGQAAMRIANALLS